MPTLVGPARPELLLVNAPLSAAGLPGGLYPPLSSLALASFLVQRGLSVRILDPSVTLAPPSTGTPEAVLDEIAETIRCANPWLCGITAMGHLEGRFALALAHRLKQQQPARPVILGGSWATGAAATILRRAPWIDAIAPGPAEHTLLELFQAGSRLDASRPVAEWLKDRPGWQFRTATDELRSTGPAKRPTLEDSTPLCPSLLAGVEHYDTLVYVSSRGCPFACSFCSDRLLFPGRLDEPLPKVAEDLARLTAALPRASYLWVSDPLFGTPRRRLAGLLPLLQGTGLRFLYESRVDVLMPQDVATIRDAGGDLVYLGLEAVTDQALLRINKVRTPAAAVRYRERTRDLVAACAAADVLPVLGVLQPLPGDQPAELAHALGFLDELTRIAQQAAPPDRPILPFFHAFPYRIDPGTPAWAAADQATRELGAQWSGTPDDPDDPTTERLLRRASHTVDEAATRAFRDEIRQRQRLPPPLLRRVLRSVPRGYLFGRWDG